MNAPAVEFARAKAKTAALARPLPAADLPPFFEQASRDFGSAGESELAKWAFGEARRVEANHPGLRDMDRLHKAFLEFVPAHAVAPTVLRDHVALMSEHLSQGEAYDRFQEILEAAFAEGFVPYARIFTDLRPLAKAARIKKKDAENGLAERLLRTGVMPGASYAIWNAAKMPLGRIASQDTDLMDLLPGAEPEPERIRQIWLAALADAGAGAYVPREWFFTSARDCEDEVLLRLAAQSDSGPAVPWTTSGDDPAFPPAVPDYSVADTRDRDSPLFWDLDTDFDAVAAGDRDDLLARLDAFARHLDAYMKAIGPELLRRAWSVPKLRRLLLGLVQEWKAEAASGSLPELDHALARLVPLAQTGLADLDPGFADGLECADPLTALLRALRGGIPAELTLPVRNDHHGREDVTVLQNGDDLTIAWRSHGIDVISRGNVLDQPNDQARYPEGEIGYWYDDGVLYRSRLHNGRWQTFRVGSGPQMPLTLESAERYPDRPSTSEVIFPGAVAQSSVTYSRGLIALTAPDGTVTGRVPYSPRQRLDGRGARPVAPPGWWPWLRPTDPDGSVALRGLTHDQAERLLDAALTGPRAAIGLLANVLPDLTSCDLREAAARTACTAAECLRLSGRLHALLGTAPPSEWLPRPRPDLPITRSVPFVSTARRLAGVLEEAAARPGDPHLIGLADQPVPNWAWHTFGTLGARALDAVWPWSGERWSEPGGLIEDLRGWGNTPWGDGSGRWRLLRLRYRGPGHAVGWRHELWRTSNGALVIVRPDEALEYSPDARFGPTGLPDWTTRDETPQGWGGADEIATLTRLAAERGPVRPDPSWARDLAERTGLPISDAAAVCFGFPSPQTAATEIRALYDRPEHSLAHLVEQDVREHLIPDDPAELWNGVLSVSSAAARYLELAGRPGE